MTGALRTALAALAVLALLAVPAAAAHRPARPAARHHARSHAAASFRPRIRHAMGIQPVYGTTDGGPLGSIPLAYHGGSVMRNVTVHTVFWAPSGTHFDGSPGGGTPGYQALIQQFLGDVAHDSGSTANGFSLINQFGDGAGNGSYQIHYDPAADSITDTHPYPPTSAQCPSPSGTESCVSDSALQQELDRVIGPHNPAARGLSNLWLIFLPPDVDTCLTLGSCATNAYAGYHSLFDLGHGSTVYAAIPDPLLELNPPPGSDPQGNPEAESAIDTLAHETVEAVTDPKGTGWMDPNGFEVADKCESGPQVGSPIGYAPDGSPYNQLINGHQYLIQDMWSNARGGCVSSSSAVGSTPGLHTVYLRQFSPAVSGSLGRPRRVPVTVLLGRAGDAVATAHTESRANGTWGPVILRDRHGHAHAVGDDRDQLGVSYGSGANSSAGDVIQTGDGGNPFTQSGYTGWFDLDHGNAVLSFGGQQTVLVGPCSQTGVLSLRVGNRLTESPTDLCANALNAAPVPVSHVTARTPITLSSLDNRGESLFAPDGALVKLTVSLGEPNSVAALNDNANLYGSTGFPSCTAYLRIRTVRCDGLVPGSRYHLVRRGRTLGRARAGDAGAVTFARLRLAGGNVLTLVNSAGRRLSSLHVAHLRVDIVGNQTVVASGTCQPGDYWGAPVSSPPPSSQEGTGIGGDGTICPASGRAKGLSTADLAQTDDFSGGQTVTQVPAIQSTSPLQDETLYGGFVASAQTGLPGPHGSVSAGGVPVSLTITRAGSSRPVFRAANVDTAAGAPVSGLAAGAYTATWVLHDASGDTRTVTTRFTDEG